MEGGARADHPDQPHPCSLLRSIARISRSITIARVVPLQDNRIMASGGDTAVTTQPRSKRKEVEQFVSELDPTQVVGE